MTIIDNVWNINERDANGKLLNVEFARVNPLSIIETFDIRQETNRSVADAKLSLTPIKGLNIDITNGFDTYGQQGTTFQERMPYAGVNSVAAAFYPDGYVSNAKLNYFQWTGDVVASYKFNPSAKLQSTTTDWEELTEESFKTIFKNSAIKRTKFSGIKRNLNFLNQ